MSPWTPTLRAHCDRLFAEGWPSSEGGRGIRKLMRHPGPASLYGAVGIGALLPTCSCGVIPLAVSFYLNGARLAAVITFAAATGSSNTSPLASVFPGLSRSTYSMSSKGTIRS